MTFRDPHAHLNAALDRANRILTGQYTPEIVFDARVAPALDVEALRSALHAALAALDAEGADDEERPDSDFTRPTKQDAYQRARDSESGSFTSVENRESNHRAGQRKSGDFTVKDSAMSFDQRRALAKVRTPAAFSGSDFYSEFGIARPGRPQ